jgi:hypothetical protein
VKGAREARGFVFCDQAAELVGRDPDQEHVTDRDPRGKFVTASPERDQRTAEEGAVGTGDDRV